MHTRSRTWPLNSDPVQRCRDRTGLIDSPDGSTLSLDFTTGVLDPRLTFTRSGNATFINNSGLVEWAPANMAGAANLNSTTSFNCYNTGSSPNMETPTLVSGPNGNANTASSFTLTAAGFIDARFGTAAILGTVSGFSIGITYTISYYFKATRNGSPIASVGVRVSPSGSGYQTVTNIVDVAVGNGFTYRTCQFVPTATSYGFVWAYGNFNSGDILVCSSIQVEPGTTARSYIQTSGAQYYGPRFDHDPTAIGTPRGLLIEGSASNLSPYSNLQSAWAGGTNTTLTPNTTDVLSPDGTNNAAKVALTNSGYCSRFESITGLAASTAYTFSYWIRGTAGNQQRVYSVTAGADLITQTTLSYSTSGWTRVQINFTTTAAVSNVYIYVVSRPTGTASDVMYIWGVQLETGTGASSLIPTGASQGSRATDVCTIGVDAGTATNFSSWWPLNQSQFTVAWTGDLVRNTSTVQFLWLTRNSVNTSVMRVFANSTSGQPLLGFAGNSIPTSVTVNGIPGATLKTALAAQEGDQAFYANNGTVSSSGVAANTGLAFTSVSMNFNPNADQFMHIKSFKFWPTRLPNAQLQSLTT